MEKFRLSDRYTLELHWKKVIYELDGVCRLKGAYFSGPAIIEAERINDNDSISLDFFSQYLVLVKSVYIAKLSWGKVTYDSNGIVKLDDTIISHDTELNRVPKLKNKDYLVIDTRDHTPDRHLFTLVYKTYVVNENTNLYNFRN